MTSKPRRSGSKGIRIYYHFRPLLSFARKAWERTRESHNYHTGLEAVRSLMADKTVKIVGIGCESGAMCLHYERKW